jgi:hypothetical protein
LRTRVSEDYVMAVVLLGLSREKAVKMYGVEAVASVMKEMNQLHNKAVWHSVDYKDIVYHTKVITSFLFLKRKRDDTLKARFLADGSMQQRLASEDNSSPTIATESLFVIATIFATGRRLTDRSYGGHRRCVPTC